MCLTDSGVLADDEASGDVTAPNTGMFHVWEPYLYLRIMICEADGEEAQLTEDPFNAELESTLDDWEGDLTHDADADLDQSWEDVNEGEAEDEVDLEHHTQAGTTLSAKRSFDDVELEDNEYETERPESPGKVLATYSCIYTNYYVRNKTFAYRMNTVRQTHHI
jgi:hypothetical protein